MITKASPSSFEARSLSGHQAPVVSSGERFHQRPLRVLLADDNAVIQKIVVKMLENLGHRADAVGSGEEVLDALEHAFYDVVLMDLLMPGLDGMDTARKIKNERRPLERPRLIAMTAYAVKGDRERCLAAGMEAYLSKPIKIDELRRVLAGRLNTASS